jgi:hypothetical protein
MVNEFFFKGKFYSPGLNTCIFGSWWIQKQEHDTKNMENDFYLVFRFNVSNMLSLMCIINYAIMVEYGY